MCRWINEVGFIVGLADNLMLSILINQKAKSTSIRISHKNKLR